MFQHTSKDHQSPTRKIKWKLT